MRGRELSGTERVIFGRQDVDSIADRLGRYLTWQLGSGISAVLFRAGRIDAVWAVHTEDGRDIVVKAHRQPVDLAARTTATQAQRLLADAGFPCPAPITGPDRFDGLVLSTETLITGGSRASARHPDVRRSIAGGLAAHIDILRNSPDLAASAGPGPAWSQYRSGPWPKPHDPIFDFRTTPDGYEWLDGFAGDATHQLLTERADDPTVVGHADWYCGNLRFDNDRLVAAFDWDLVADTEPVIVGLSAGSYTAGGPSGTGPPTPDEVAAFLADYDNFRSHPFSARQQRVAAAAASWVIAYNARCELGLSTSTMTPGPIVDLVYQQRNRYLDVHW